MLPLTTRALAFQQGNSHMIQNLNKCIVAQTNVGFYCWICNVAGSGAEDERYI